MLSRWTLDSFCEAYPDYSREKHDDFLSDLEDKCAQIEVKVEFRFLDLQGHHYGALMFSNHAHAQTPDELIFLPLFCIHEDHYRPLHDYPDYIREFLREGKESHDKEVARILQEDVDMLERMWAVEVK